MHPGNHPRACGAHQAWRHGRHELLGSSPRMRGSPYVATLRGAFLGIIPAHAGLTVGDTNCSHAIRDHPRACGAHLARYTSVKCLPGSSPRMRGSLVLSARSLPRNGIIPAHAGLTHSRLPSSFCSRDHPRACGAHRIKRRVADHDAGSSPRMRGSQSWERSRTGNGWIIPAHAGLTAF